MTGGFRKKRGPEQKFLVAFHAKFLAGTVLSYKGPPCCHLRGLLRGDPLVRGSGHAAHINTSKNPRKNSRDHCQPLLLCFYGQHLCDNKG